MWLIFFVVVISWGVGQFPAHRVNGFVVLSLVALWALGVLHFALLTGLLWLIITPAPRWNGTAILILGVGLLGLGHPREILLGGSLLAACAIWLKEHPHRPKIMRISLMGWIAALVLYKLPTNHLEWLGFSYLILRFIMVNLENQPPVELSHLLIYTCNPLTLLAGPIDRPERFWQDLQAWQAVSGETQILGLQRLAGGLLKKFILADSLALIALSPQLSADVQSIGGAWLITYAYAWRLFWDFSGYTDIVIGLGLWAGFHLPENFQTPYFKPNLALFWQNWHITLTAWFRTYVFLPFVRELLRRKSHVPVFLLGQVLTLSLIGAWHGMTLNFWLWGMWHALGLWGHHLWSRHSPWRLPQIVSLFLTFHYVVLGWVWFALPEPQMSLAHFGKLFGL